MLTTAAFIQTSIADVLLMGRHILRVESMLKYRLNNRLEINDDYPLPEEIAIQNEEVQILYKCLDACTLDQRTVIIARFIQDLSIAETAKFLGWSESKVKTTQHRALKVLRKKMNNYKEKED